MHCVAEYPCHAENLRLGNILKLKQEFESDNIKIGYSGHEEGIIPTLAAIDLGAMMIERHFCMSRHSFVHHIECSLEPDEYKQLIELSDAKDLKKIYEPLLPPVAFREHFGMSKIEEDFLLNCHYGNTYLHSKDKVAFHDSII